MLTKFCYYVLVLKVEFEKFENKNLPKVVTPFSDYFVLLKILVEFRECHVFILF
jgi:hypothetical protein